MQLIDIDKARYRKHLNIVIVSFIGSLLALSLLFGTILISLFSTIGDANELLQVGAEALQVEQESNFRYNLLGVILALLANAAVLHSLKKSDFFREIYYVWQIKQLQNLIYRRLKKIKIAAKAGEEDALIILFFYYQSQLQVYKLDDNTITLETIERHKREVEDMIAEFGFTITTEQFSKPLLAQYK